MQMDTHLGSILDEVIVKVFILQNFIWIVPCMMGQSLVNTMVVKKAL